MVEKDAQKLLNGWYYIKLPKQLANNVQQPIDTCFYDKIEKRLPPTRCIQIIDGEWRHHHEFSTKDQSFCIPEDMIESPAFKIGEEVEVRDRDSQEWGRRSFSGYQYYSDYPYRVGSNGFVFCRAIPEPEIEITIKINGKSAKLSDISDETLKKIKEAE